MKWIFLLSGLLLPILIFAQKEYVKNQPAKDKGSFYTGYLKDGKYHGQGTYYYSFKRAYYKGPWKNGLKHGKGTLVQFSGNTYRATWVDDEIIGEVSYEFVNEGDVLYRRMANGNFTDAYKLVYHNGTVLEGTTKAGDLEGMVTYTFKDGSQQEVAFTKGKPAAGDGFVKDNFAYFKKFKEGYYTGDWQNEAPHGKGGFSGRVVYRGEWVNGIKEGEGYIYYNNNNTYRGHFENGLRNGKGIMRYQADKSYAEGNFVKNLLEGPGTYTLASGTSFSGNFIGSDFDGEVIGTDTEGKITYYTFKDGKQVKDTSTEIVAKAEDTTAEKEKAEAVAVNPQFPAKLEGEDLMHFLFNKYEDRQIAYWLVKHPEQLFKELDWKFTMPGIAVAYPTGNYGKDAQKKDKPHYYSTASYVEISEGFEGKLPGGMEYDAFVNAIVQEDFNLLNTYYNQVTSKRYELEYRSNTDVWDDFVMSLKNGQGSLWVHGIKGFPSSFKVRFIRGKIDLSTSAHQSEKKWLSDRSTRGGDCTTCKLENQGKKRIYSSAELEYMAAVNDAKVDLSMYKNHPQLKFLGRSIYDPEVAALIAKNADAGDKSIFIPLDFSRYKWSDRLESEVRGRPAKKGYWYVLDEISGSIAGVLFVRKEDKFWKWKAYKGDIPYPEKWMEVLKFKGLETFRISPDKEEEVFQKNLEIHMDQLIKTQVGTDALVQSKEDLERFSIPKGEDIWKLAGAKPDKVLNAYLFANRWAFDKSYKYGIDGDGDNEYYVDGNNKHIIRTLRNVGYEYVIKGSSDNDFAAGNIPIDIRVEFDLGIILPQLENVPGYNGTYFKETTKKVFNREVKQTIVQASFLTAFGNRGMYMYKYEDQEGGRFSDLTFSSEKSVLMYGSTELTQANNPWKMHNETLVVVSKADEKVYLNAFEKLFAHMETGFESVAEKGGHLINNEVKRVHLNSSIEFPKSTIGYATITQYKDTDLNWYKAKLTEDVKNEYINVLLLRKYAGDYRIIGSKTDSESTFGKTMIIEKDQKVVGSVTFERHKDEENNWWMEVQTFSEERFQESLQKVVTQATKDDYSAWRGERVNEKGVSSTYDFYNARSSFLIDARDDSEKVGFSCVFENTPAYLIDYTLNKWKKGSNLGGNITVLENFRRYGAMTRIVTLKSRGIDFMISFEPTTESLNRIEISHGEDFSQITEAIFTPANLSKTTALAMQSMEGQGYDLVWSSDYDWQFFFKFDNYFNQNTISGQYMVLLVYESSRIKPPYASVSGRVDGQFMSLKTDPDRAEDMGDNFMMNVMSFALEGSQSSFTLGGSYGFKDDGLIVKALLYKKR